MKKYFVLLSKINKDHFKVSNTQYDTSFSKKVEDGFLILNFDSSKISITFSKEGEIPSDYLIQQVGFPLISNKLRNILISLLAEEKEFLEIVKIESNLSHKSDYYALNVLNNIDCLDKKNTKLKFFDGSTVIEKAENIKLLNNRIGGRNIFRICDFLLNFVISEMVKRAFELEEINSLEIVPIEEFVYGF